MEILKGEDEIEDRLFDFGLETACGLASCKCTE